MAMEMLMDSCDVLERVVDPSWTHAGVVMLGQDEEDDEFSGFDEFDDDADDEAFDEFGDDDDGLDDEPDDDDDDL